MHTTIHKVPPPAKPSQPRLGYLLKHAGLRFAEAVRTELEPLGIDVREWAILACLGDGLPRSQAEVAQEAGIDRTTMVDLADRLQAKGLVRRRRDDEDRRKNVVELTDAGRALMRRAARRVDATERRFLEVLGERQALQLKKSLQELVLK